MRLKENLYNNLIIYFLDDEKDLCHAVKGVLSDFKINIITFTDHNIFIKKCIEQNPDIIIIDFFLKNGQTGDKVILSLREKNIIPIKILLTGYQNLVQPINTILKLDIDYYCEKEANYNQLILAILSAQKMVKMKGEINRLNQEKITYLSDSLHSIGNILNSIKISMEVIELNNNSENVKKLARANKLLHKTIDEKVIEYFNLITKMIQEDKKLINYNINRINNLVLDIQEVLINQQKMLD